MSEKNSRDNIEQLKSELILKNKEISNHLERIEYLENLIMELEASLSEKTGKTNMALININLKDLKRKNQELKEQMSFLRLENIKLKQELEKIKKGYFDISSLIQVVNDKAIKSKSGNEIRINEHQISKEELFKYVQIKCPKCDMPKSLKIPTQIVNQMQNVTSINIPRGVVCDHSFQVIIDKFFTVKRYEIVTFEFQDIEYAKTDDIEKKRMNQDIINVLRSSIDNRDILGAAIFSEDGMVIYASIPSNILYNILNEFQVRKEKQLQEMTKMFIELRDNQKFFSESIKILNEEVNIVLIFSERVTFGMGTLLFKDLKDKLQKFTINHTEGLR
ncbi:MAG: hypothetical protein ACFFFB_09500 [Candidatus Heimdallarchaeota archaeon]